MTDIKKGTILLVLTSEEADLIIDGLYKILYGGEGYSVKDLIEAVHLANYIEERLNEVENREIL